VQILLIKPDPDDAARMRKRIEGCGHPVDVALSAEAALSLAAQKAYEIAFVDLAAALPLENEGSKSLFEQLKKLCPEIRMVGLTDRNSRNRELAARRQGVIFYMIQPADDAYIEPIVQYVAGQLQGRKERRLTKRWIT